MMPHVEDRSMQVQPHETVRVAWVSVDRCRLGSRMPLSPEAVEKKWRKLLVQDQAASWPPLVGHWPDGPDGSFQVDDGRHEFVASLMRGREEVLVAWITPREGALERER
jgi:hypothetical protein